jgi:hypothetical protein
VVGARARHGLGAIIAPTGEKKRGQIASAHLVAARAVITLSGS